jgi:hypothetical protein
VPKRVLDGDGLWRSDKLAQVEPVSFRAEYANLVPLALANGSFEAGPRRIWASVYSYNRPDVTLEMVEAILSEFERVKLLFRWTDQRSGKKWGYWVGIDKLGRLPSPSRLKKRHEALGEEPPAQALQAFLNEDKKPMANHPVANGEEGFGFGTGFGTGIGFGKPSSPEGSERVHSKPRKPAAKSKSDPRFTEFVKILNQYWHFHNPDEDLGMNSKAGNLLNGVLRDNPSLTAEKFMKWLTNRTNSVEVNHAEPVDSWIHSVKKYSGGPLNQYGRPLAEVENGKGQQHDFDVIEAAVERRRVGRLASATAEGYEGDVSQLEVNA